MLVIGHKFASPVIKHSRFKNYYSIRFLNRFSMSEYQFKKFTNIEEGIYIYIFTSSGHVKLYVLGPIN